MTKLLTTSEVAARIGITVNTVNQRALRLGIKPAAPAKRQALWHESDLKRFGPKCGPGRPRKTDGAKR